MNLSSGNSDVDGGHDTVWLVVSGGGRRQCLLAFNPDEKIMTTSIPFPVCSGKLNK
jgi:hypothetical protein